eukprot:TRINITY_DN59633_c1_g1_i1.p1 TRINITY_DN59633_c1_g1~~TRINITY_DN59633_c1_g1_i1.p1  ORF type:complete len:224 (+),score=47.83 TRINITY_DN59633_c1_g1_i1:42-713(+)
MGHRPSKEEKTRKANQAKGRAKVTERDRAILQLKTARDKLLQYQTRIENMPKRNAREKKQCQEILKRSTVQLNNLMEMLQTIEVKQIEAEFVKGMKLGTAALKDIQQQLGDVEAAMAEAQEAVDDQNEINATLGVQLEQGEDDDELLAEFEKEQAEKEKPKTEPEKEKRASSAEPAKPKAPVSIPTTAKPVITYPAQQSQPKQKEPVVEDSESEEEERQPVLA